MLNRRNKMRQCLLALAIIAGVVPTSSGSGETLVYGYDAVGRLKRACHWTATVDLATYSFDQADNRTSSGDSRVDVTLTPGSGLTSDDGRFTLWLQGDGNLVLYKNYDDHASIWATNTVGTGAVLAALQADGNLVLYSASAPVWASNTGGSFCSKMVVQNDGNLVIYNWDGAPIWASNTGGH